MCHNIISVSLGEYSNLVDALLGEEELVAYGFDDLAFLEVLVLSLYLALLAEHQRVLALGVRVRIEALKHNK